MKHWFHCRALLSGELDLPEEEARHATGVLRLRAGAIIGLLDGRGVRAEAEIVAVDKRSCHVRVLSRTMINAERKARIHLAVSPTKQMERFEWMLEKCTEIGVDRITPLISERTERDKLRRDRLERVLISAMKQSQRTWLPQLDEATAINELISGGISGRGYFGWCEGEHTSLVQAYRPSENSLLLIGPEGDFTREEARALIDAQYAPVSLGVARLRTETAAIAACTWMNFAQLL
jgi:16S rRNA (uracil1498-N3)-methyltransferase